MILNLPGSAKGSLESFRIVAGQLKHAVDLLRGNEVNVSAEHKAMGAQVGYNNPNSNLQVSIILFYYYTVVGSVIHK